jgi:PAS domain S-box-containing protein
MIPPVTPAYPADDDAVCISPERHRAENVDVVASTGYDVGRNVSRHETALTGATLGTAGLVAVGSFSDRELVELELRESQRALATLMDNLPGMAYRCRNDPDWTMDFVSQGSLALTGYEPAELVSNARASYGQLIVPEDRERVAQEVQKALLAKVAFRIFYRILSAAGAERWVWEQGCGVFSKQGELQAIEGFITDITEAKRAEDNGRRLLLAQAARAAAEQNLQAERTARELSERSRAHAEFLVDATRILSSSFDTTTTLNQLAHLCVRFLGTCCAVSLYGTDDDGYLALVHGAGHHEAHSRRTIAEWKATADEDQTLRLRQRRGEAFIIGSAEAAEFHEHAVLLEALGARVLLSVPIAVVGSVMGSILFIGGPDRAAFDVEERSGAEELGRRAVVALQAAQSYHDALAAAAARDEILAVVAHDLRNPLSTIHMGSSLALDLMAPEPTTPGRRQLEVIVRTAERMNRLIQDLLDATRLQSGKLALELVPARPGAIIDEAVEMLLPLASHAGITLEAGVVSAVEAIYLDRLRIQQVLSNLIGNALKFTPSGGSVRVSAEQAAGEVCFLVTDTGHGIAADQLPHVFGRFWQARRTDRRGLGLGLAIARGIVEAHGGTIRVDSLPGAGSTFAFTIPAIS